MVISAMLVLKQKAIVQAFARAGATTSAMACTPDQLGVNQGMAWHRLVTHAVMRCPGNGRYFLDVPNWERLRRLRRRIALAVITGLVLILAVIMLTIGTR